MIIKFLMMLIKCPAHILLKLNVIAFYISLSIISINAMQLPQEINLDLPYTSAQKQVERLAALLVCLEDHKPLEQQIAKQVIDDVINMYQQDIKADVLKKTIFFHIDVNGLVIAHDASYTHLTRTFKFPRIISFMRGVISSTAINRAIVSWTAGCLVFSYLKQLEDTPNTKVLREVFADCTSQFYKFYNVQTRKQFIFDLEKAVNVHEEKGAARDNVISSVVLSHTIYRSMVAAYLSIKQDKTEEKINDIVTWHRKTFVWAIESLKMPNPTLIDVAFQMLANEDEQSKYYCILGSKLAEKGFVISKNKAIRTDEGRVRLITAYSPNYQTQSNDLVVLHSNKSVR